MSLVQSRVSATCSFSFILQKFFFSLYKNLLVHFLLRFAFSVKGDFSLKTKQKSAEIAQVGERETENLNFPGSIPGFGDIFIFFHHENLFLFKVLQELVGQETKKPILLTHFYISILKNYSICFLANDDTSYQQRVFLCPIWQIFVV